jgi:hypothetical protein
VRNIMIAVQVTVSLALLITAGLFVRAEMRIVNRHPGYEAAHVFSVAPRIRTPPYTASTAASFYQRLADRTRAIPGVRRVSFASAPPFGEGDLERNAPVGAVLETTDGGRVAMTSVNTVSRDYFATLDIAITYGRLFEDGERASGLGPTVLSATAARAVAPNRNPIGLIVQDIAGARWQIVGIARDINALGSKDRKDMTMYVPRPADAVGDAMLVRFEADARAVSDQIRRAIADLDPDAIVEPRTLAALREDAAERLLNLVRMALTLAAAALGLALIGVYGVVAFGVRLRSREFGIHMALGATRASIVRLVLYSGVKPIASGLGCGVAVSLAGSIALSRLFRDAPIPLDPRDPTVYFLVPMILVAAAALAMIGPAMRAAWADPARVLRQD